MRLAVPVAAAVLLGAALVKGCSEGPDGARGAPVESAGGAEVTGDGEDTGARWFTPPGRACVEPAAARDADGTLWLAWIAFEGDLRNAEGRLVVARVGDAGIETVAVEAPWPAEPALTSVESGVYVAFEAAGEGGDGRRLVGARVVSEADGGLARTGLETIATGGVLFPTPLGTETGRVDLVFQQLVDGEYRVMFTQRAPSGAWAEARAVPAGPGDAWCPRAVRGADGVVHVVHDRFDGESFDVEYVALVEGVARERLLVASGPSYQGMPAVALDPDGRPWIAWESAPQFGEIGGLRDRRSLRVAAVEGGRVRHVPASHLPPDGERADLPRIACTADGLVVTARAPGESFVPGFATEYAAFYTSWFTHALELRPDGPPRETVLGATDGDGDATEVLLAGADGGVTSVFAADLRTRRRPKPGAFEEAVEQLWRVGALELAASGYPPLVDEPVPDGRAAGPRPARGPAGGPRRFEERAPRSDGRRPVFGDLHRHTQVSRCQGAEDGTRLDVWRYARGPGALDFVSVTDHYQHLTPWTWWRTLRDIERFHAPGSLVTLAGVERALRERAHVNEVYLDASEVPLDVTTFHRGPEEAGPTPLEHTVAIPHMMGMPSAPFPWKAFREDLHRLVEVYQGLRGAYEGPSLPYQAMNREVDASSLAEGLRRGKHFGLVASSDHRASSTAYAGAWAAELTRESVFDALRERHAFAATAHVVVDARVGDLRMGQEGAAPADLPFVVLTESAAPVATFELVKNGETVAFGQGDGPTELVVVSCRRYQVLAGDGLTLRVEGGELVDARLRTPGETGAELVVEDDGTVHLRKGVPWIDVVLEIEPAGDGAVLVLEDGNRADRVRLADLPPGRSLAHPPTLDRESVWRVGRPLEPGRRDRNGRFVTILTPPADAEDARAEGDSYYARVVFADGNVAWSSPLRVTSVAR